ncbi:hypothetical protein C2G38_2067703 [Gigaspora rosea]|uniref:Uncharacterized protein n=1 Tax=Gigaspora rosea TaxID=44941 RepID=A0A397VUA7_9GLOM|nr:hypothetical protein C2G38_2067703 [Gigaspora rosea]
MHYYWNDWDDHLKKFDFEKTKFKNLFNEGRILPASSYETILKNLNVKFGTTKLFEKFLEDNIDEEFYLSCYGKIIKRTFIELKDEKWIRRLGYSCINKCLQDDNHLISKISLLSVIFENFNELSENYPAFIASILSKIGFVVPSTGTTINSKSNSDSYIFVYGRYYHLLKHHFLIY